MSKKWYILIGLVLFCWLVAFTMYAFSATLQWDRNTESDMKEYRVKGCDTVGCTIDPTVNLGVVPQPSLGVNPTFPLPQGKEGKRAVTAVDLSGNESALSVILPFDVNAPNAPVNLQVK